MDNQTYNRYILAVNKTGNLTAAARELGISQPALSSGLNLFEEKLGFKLFDRKQKPIVPTKEGSIYIEYLMKQLLLEKDCFKKINDLLSDGDNRLRVGGSMVYTQSLITQSLDEFEKLYPNALLYIHTDALPNLIELVQNGELDCIISTSANLPDNFVYEELYHEHLYICVPKSFNISCGDNFEQMKFEAINGCSAIFLPDDLPLQKTVNSFLLNNNIELKKKLVVDQVAIAVELAAAGKGIAIATQTALFNKKYSDLLDLYPLPKDYFDRIIYVAYIKERYITKMCSDYMEMLKKKYRGISE